MPRATELVDPSLLPHLLPEGSPDPAYPQSTPPDVSFPGQTREPLGHPLDEIATPSMWSRLEGPIERALETCWRELGLPERSRPRPWVTLHYGRIAVNAHGWERMRARLAGEIPDPNLVEAAQGLFATWTERVEALRARLSRRKLERRIERAAQRRERALDRLGSLDAADLDPGELARGPIDENTWTEILLPWIGDRLAALVATESDACLRAAIALEQRCNVELGLRLATRRTLGAPAQVAYLTVEERIRAVHDGASHWAELAALRQERVEQFTKVDVPLVFWGRPRVETEKA